MTQDFQIVAYPRGARTIVGACVSDGADSVVIKAAAHAKVRGEFVDVIRDGVHIAVVGADGPVAA